MHLLFAALFTISIYKIKNFWSTEDLAYFISCTNFSRQPMKLEILHNGKTLYMANKDKENTKYFQDLSLR